MTTKGKGGDLTSIIEPPSHILADGRHVFLPPPSVHEKASFFARCVAKHGLIHADTKIAKQTKDDDDDGEDDDDDDNDEQFGESSKNDDDLGVIHPLAVASARLECNGISELSKSINLTTLIQSGEYFAFSNIVESSLSEGNVAGHGGINININKAGMNMNMNSSKDASMSGRELDMDANEANLRSKFILKRKRQQYIAATDALTQQYERLRVITAAQRVVDERLMQLRRRWRLAAPEHGAVVLGPVRPSETIAIDVDIYKHSSSQSQSRATLGKIARKVPRYATIDLAEDFDVKSLPKRTRTTSTSTRTSSSVSIKEDPNTDSEADMIMANDDDDAIGTNSSGNATADATGTDNMESSSLSVEPKSHNPIHTVASPFAVADPTMGTDSEIFDPDNVPMLTLYFQIEKSSTGFLHSVALSSSIKLELDPTKGTKEAEMKMGDVIASIVDDKVKLYDDEKTIQMLQHSLFCANIFDAIRKEIVHSGSHSVPAHTGGSGGIKGRQSASMQQQQQQQQPVWLSSEMEENFLPPPSLMAGNCQSERAQRTGDFDAAPLSVVHCHEGEVKVQLDSEYALTVKLVDVKNGSASHNEVGDSNTNAGVNEDDVHISRLDSGSQSRDQLHILCRMLLLHAQFVFHDHNKRSAVEEEQSEKMGVVSKGVDYSVHGKSLVGPLGGGGRNAMLQKNRVERTPMILQSCVVLGSKVLFERKVRDVLENLSDWQRKNKPSMNFTVEWLPLSTFDSHAQMAICFGDALSIDLHISGGKMTVTSFSNEGDYRMVHFESSEEFELYMKMEMKNFT